MQAQGNLSVWYYVGRQDVIHCAMVLRTASYPRQFGEGGHAVFAGDIVPKTLELFLKQST